MARLRSAGNQGGCPVVEVDQKSPGCVKNVENDPDVWSGRASQEVFVEVAVSGLASMYPASDWSVLCSGPPWISARVRPHERTGLIGPFGSPVLAPPGRPILHLVSSSRRPRR